MPDNILSDEEVNALLKGIAENPEGLTSNKKVTGDVRNYNFATDQPIVRSRLPVLDLINERCSRLLGATLHKFLSRSVAVSIDTISLLKSGELLEKLAGPTSLNLMHIKPLHGTALIVIDPNLIFLLVDNLFGGDGRFHKPIEGRDFTQTEQRIILQILNIIFDAFTKSWQPIFPIEFQYIRSETNTKYINFGTQNDLIVCTTINVNLGQFSGQIQFCIPYLMLEPIRDTLSTSIQSDAVAVNKPWRRLMTQQIQLAEVEVVADLGYTTMSLRDILSLRVGDVIPLSIPDMLHATVDGNPVLECKYGIFDSQYALKVDKLLCAHEVVTKS